MHTALIVEDNPIIQLITKSHLEKLGYLVDVVSNGLEAVNLLENEKFDVILMDCIMPVMNGYEATKIIRQIDEEVTIIGITSNDFEETRQECYKAGMNGFLPKPISKKALLQAICSAQGVGPYFKQDSQRALQLPSYSSQPAKER